MAAGLLLGGLAAGGLGGLASIGGSVLQAQSAKSAAEAQRDYLERIRQENIQLASRTSREQYEQGLKELNRARQEEGNTLQAAKFTASRQAMDVFGSAPYQGFAQFVSSTLSGQLPDAIQQQVTGQFRQAQEARGLTGAAASRDESRAWGAYLYGQAQQVLPLARQIAMDPFELTNRAQMDDIGITAAARALGTQGLQQYLATAQGAQQIAQSQYSPILSSNTQLASQVPFSTANPLAAGLGALGQLGAGIGGSLLGGALQPRKDTVSASNYSAHASEPAAPNGAYGGFADYIYNKNNILQGGF